MLWHQLEINQVISALQSSINGLSTETAEKRLLEYGLNELKQKREKPAWLLFLEQLKDFMILVLIAAAILSGLIGELTDTIVIIAIVLLNAVMGFTQEYRAHKVLNALKKMASPQATVIRDGTVMTIPSSRIVPGDLVLLEAGNLIPADIRVMESYGLRTDESSLTGESEPVDKKTGALAEKDLTPGDQLNMAFKGTMVTYGKGKGVVVATGMHTEIGRIAQMLQYQETQSPLQIRMADFGKKLSYIILLICLIIFGVGLLRGEKPLEMLLLAVSLAVAAIPEALPALITVTLARGAKKLVKKNALIRKLPAVETLGSVTFICSDKTGTITQNKMNVVKVIASHTAAFYKNFPLLELAMSLNQDVQKTAAGIWQGDPTEVAIINYIEQKYGYPSLQEIEKKFLKITEWPFDSDRKCMTTIHEYDHQYICITKGAVESVISRLKKDEATENILRQTNQMASDGIRVLAFAYKILEKLPANLNIQTIETHLVFAGLVGMMDPPRAEIKSAIKECKTAGIHPVMITGDHRETAAAIAREIGLLADKDLILTGKELNNLKPNELDETLERVRVYARVTPEQKLKIVRSLQRNGHFVAMTGDGINDAPALKIANIGIAMGINGTDVSKEAAHMILMDDNFATIIKAVREGRHIYDNIRKFMKYIMTCNSAEIWTFFLASLIGLPIPLQPIHILWINLATDGLPGLALASEKEEKNIMHRPPRKPNESLFADGTGYHIIWAGLLMSLLTLGTMAWAIKSGDAHWQTMVFTTLALIQLGHVFAIRSDREFIYNKGIFSNWPLLLTIFITFFFQLAIIYLPIANKLFSTQPLTVKELAICIMMAIIIFHTEELEKWIWKKINKRTMKKPSS